MQFVLLPVFGPFFRRGLLVDMLHDLRCGARLVRRDRLESGAHDSLAGSAL